jgi:hypothetical protein
LTTNSVIDVGLGLILMYLMLSLACTILNEFIASAMRLRARMLEGELTALIDNPDLLNVFRDHGLVAASAEAGGGQASYLSGRAVATALVDSLDPDKPVAVVSEVIEAATKLPPSNVRDVILVAATTAGTDIEKLRAQVASWFDDAMDRLSGVYRRSLRWLSLAIGLVLAVALNADTIALTDALWHDSALRSEIVATSEKIAAVDQAQLQQRLSDWPSIERGLRPFPLGWSTNGQSWMSSYLGVAAKIVGLLITGLALSLGAPFWFDLLSKFVNIRGTGAKPERTQAR